MRIAVLALVLLSSTVVQAAAQCFPNICDTHPEVSSVVSPNNIKLVGHDNGTVDNAGYFEVHARSSDNYPLSWVPVTIDFSDCPDVRICSTQLDGFTVDCTGKRVSGVTNSWGDVIFTIVGASNNTGASAGSSPGCAKVYVCDCQINWNGRIALFDQNGGGVRANDVSLWSSDFWSGQYFMRSDYNGNGVIQANDLAALMGIVNSGTSVDGCAEMSPSGSYCP